MARTIESSTDTQQELEKAFGKEKPDIEADKNDALGEEIQEDKPDNKPDSALHEEEPEEESEESGDSEEHEERATAEEKTEQKHKPKKGFQKRIDKLTREKYQLEARLSEYERQRAEQAAQAQQRSATQPQSEGKPRLDQFQSYDDYVEALTDWKFQQKTAQAQAEAAQRQQQEAAQRQQEEFRGRFDSYKERVEAATEKYEDWEEVTGKNILVPESASIAIIENENGPDITYYLGKHPDVVEELHGMTPAQQISRVAVIGYELAHPKPQRVQTKAPAPVQPVGGSSAGGTALPPDPSYKDYRRKWLQDQAV